MIDLRIFYEHDSLLNEQDKQSCKQISLCLFIHLWFIFYQVEIAKGYQNVKLYLIFN